MNKYQQLREVLDHMEEKRGELLEEHAKCMATNNWGRRMEILQALKKFGGYDDTAWATRKYSAVAHIRGRLHMKKVHGSTLYWACGMTTWDKRVKCVDERRHMFSWDMDLQEELVRPILNMIEGTEEEVSIPPYLS